MDPAPTARSAASQPVNAFPPRLLYLSDVPLEASYHGSALLYRLLQGYPPDRLRVVEGNFGKSLPERRLPGVAYETLQAGHTRLLNTRLHGWYSLWLSLRSAARARKVPALLGGFKPEAVLTVAHGHLWVTAAEFARHNRLPLHLIVHDDWPRVARLMGWRHVCRCRSPRRFGPYSCSPTRKFPRPKARSGWWPGARGRPRPGQSEPSRNSRVDWWPRVARYCCSRGRGRWNWEESSWDLPLDCVRCRPAAFLSWPR